jgi:hypothetical protein
MLQVYITRLMQLACHPSQSGPHLALRNCSQLQSQVCFTIRRHGVKCAGVFVLQVIYLGEKSLRSTLQSIFYLRENILHTCLLPRISFIYRTDLPPLDSWLFISHKFVSQIGTAPCSLHISVTYLTISHAVYLKPIFRWQKYSQRSHYMAKVITPEEGP